MSGGAFVVRAVLSVVMVAASVVLLLEGEPAAAAWAIGLALWVDPEGRAR